MRTGMLALCIGVVAFGQSPRQPSFEVASIRPGGGNVFSTKPEISGGTFRWTTQAAYLIGYAYNLDFSQVTSTKKNLGSIYRVEATFNDSASSSDVCLMVQSLLADRFKLEAHRSTAQGEGYALSVGKSGIKFSQATVTDNENIFATLTKPDPKKSAITEIVGQSVTMPRLAQQLQRVIQMPVWDRTGLAGKYDFRFRYAQDPNADATEPWLGTALEETLGLRIEKAKGPVETLVVDRIDEPSEN